MHADNKVGIQNLCDVAHHILDTMPINAATKFAVRNVLREAVNKSTPGYKGNNNRKNCQYVSVSAEPMSTNPSADLVADHAIPISLLLKEVYDQPGITQDQLVNLVSKYSVMVLITDAENHRLGAAGLVRKMPNDWDQKDVLARYKHVGIELMPTSRSSRPSSAAAELER